MKNQSKSKQLPIIGWREYLSLPELKITKIKAKIDTGARTSALHAFDVKLEKQDQQTWVKFKVHPLQKDSKTTIECIAPLLEHRNVTNSGGHTQKRPVIITPVKLGEYQWNIELTLTNRDVMGFRMLLGRQAVKKKFLVDPNHSYHH